MLANPGTLAPQRAGIANRACPLRHRAFLLAYLLLRMHRDYIAQHSRGRRSLSPPYSALVDMRLARFIGCGRRQVCGTLHGRADSQASAAHQLVPAVAALIPCCAVTTQSAGLAGKRADPCSGPSSLQTPARSLLFSFPISQHASATTIAPTPSSLLHMSQSLRNMTNTAPEIEGEAAPQARVRRRPRKRPRNGPPQLQFVTATDPSQFKDENAKRSVRSQAMIQYRYKSAEQKRKGSDAQETRPAETTPPATTAARVTPIMDDSWYHAAHSRLMSQWNEEPEESVYASTSEAFWSVNPGGSVAEPSSAPASTAIAPARSSRYYEVLRELPLNAAARRVNEYEDSEAHDQLLLRILIAKVATTSSLGDGVDPFTALPQFASPELNSIYLIRKCNRAFCSPSTLTKWLPAMLSHPHILLSSTIMASTFLDMHEGCSGESKRTVLVKAESIGWINERLRSPATQFDDSTLMIILHLLAGELWSCNERTLRIHESGIARLVAHRGGMERLGGNGAVAEVTAS